MSIKRLMDKQNVICLQNGKLFSNYKNRNHEIGK